VEKIMSETIYKNVDGVKVPLSEEELAQREIDIKRDIDNLPMFKLEALRQDRTPLLEEADYKINTLVDNGADATAWRKYRQELRDITNTSDLDNVTFPTKPS